MALLEKVAIYPFERQSEDVALPWLHWRDETKVAPFVSASDAESEELTESSACEVEVEARLEVLLGVKGTKKHLKNLDSIGYSKGSLHHFWVSP